MSAVSGEPWEGPGLPAPRFPCRPPHVAAPVGHRSPLTAHRSLRLV
ncbi:MAG: hypothetical protein AVDCRST_MAG11-1551 [uncultured Gemmatimonadaceae bacterium]|uniref:Uncharacterized protein n=1 Tax=uncultured Gemmatimonadaceae bacterium TaxID=246130 RepID=A0A6J4KPJ0_9BACT|nr:MAG: hypothetical protein AVDCRST_MAG11-1551 [uncultured Gemmatimonadaceae bacterium]